MPLGLSWGACTDTLGLGGREQGMLVSGWALDAEVLGSEEEGVAGLGSGFGGGRGGYGAGRGGGLRGGLAWRKPG
jgi:hypothetical protein